MKEVRYSSAVYYLFILSLVLMWVDVALHYNDYASSFASGLKVEKVVIPTIRTVSLWIMGYAGTLGLLYLVVTRQLSTSYSYLLAAVVIAVTILVSIS